MVFKPGDKPANGFKPGQKPVRPFTSETARAASLKGKLAKAAKAEKASGQNVCSGEQLAIQTEPSEADRAKLMKLLSEQPQPIVGLADKLKLPAEWVYRTVLNLAQYHDGVQLTPDGRVFFSKGSSVPGLDRRTALTMLDTALKGKVIRFGFITDTHLGSKHCNYKLIHQLYDTYEAEEISLVINGGDLVAGEGMYRGQSQEITKHGFDAQAAHFVKGYPKRASITTWYILGNHCMSHYNNSGAHLGSYIDPRRDDMKWLGNYYARLEMQGVTIDVIHPDKGGAYALSYHPQKYIDNIRPADRPHVALFGHWHVSGHFTHGGVEVVLGGCTEGQSYYLARKGLQPEMCGSIVEITLSGDPADPIERMSWIKLK